MRMVPFLTIAAIIGALWLFPDWPPAVLVAIVLLVLADKFYFSNPLAGERIVSIIGALGIIGMAIAALGIS